MNDKIAGYKGTIAELVKQRDRYKKALELICARLRNDCYAPSLKCPNPEMGCIECRSRYFLNEAEK